MATESQETITYLASDFDSIKQELIEKLQETESWTDLYEGGIGMTLIELYSYVGDMLSFYINMMANETYLDTAKLKSSVISLCKMIRYKLALPSSATCNVKFTLDSTHSENITISQFTKLARFDEELGENIYYLTDEDLLIKVGALEGTVAASQGERVTGLGIGTSNGTVNQQFPLNKIDVAAESIKLYIDGEEWEEVEFLIDNDEDDEVYKIDWESNEELYVTFGDNKVGKIPEDSSVLTFDYSKCEEDYGNTGLNTITYIISGPGGNPIVDELDANIQSLLSVTNIEQATGGGAVETATHAKLYAPKISRAAERAVSIEDYEGLIGHLSGIAKVKCVDRKISDGIPFRQIWVYAVPRDGGSLSSTQELAINELLQLKSPTGTDWLINDTSFVSSTFNLTYFYPNPAYANTVENKIITTLQDYFDIENEDRIYGETIYRNNLIILLNQLSEVALIEMTSPISDVELTFNQYPILGNITLVNGGLI